MATLNELNAQLDDSEARLPKMVEDYLDPRDFWPGFAGAADVIEDAAGEHCDAVREQISATLAQHGCYLAGVDEAPASYDA